MPAEVLALLDGDIAVHMADGLADVYAEAFAAFGYGHTSRPGQRWHDRAADALAADEAARCSTSRSWSSTGGAAAVPAAGDRRPAARPPARTPPACRRGAL